MTDSINRFTRSVRRTLTAILGAGTLVMALAAAPGVASASAPHTCTGTLGSPGVLKGDYGNVSIDGVCAVNAGRATVHGTLTLLPHSALLAAFGQQGSRLVVTGNVIVQRGAALLLGCIPSSSPCLDDPSQEHPTLSSHPSVGGNLIATDALGVIVHNATIAGNVNQLGGGGGLTCNPVGLFAAFGSPAFTTYEDSTIGGSIGIRRMHSCWLGVIRDQIGKNAEFINNQLADPDAIEIMTNQIGRNLACRGNSQVWDNADIGESLFPRQPGPNTVAGQRSGQCVVSSPNTQDDQPGPGPF